MILQMVDDMSVEELVGQMTWTQVYGNSADDTSEAETNMARYGVSTPAEVVEKFNLGGVLYFTWSNPIVASNPTATAELSNGLQAASTGADGSGIPLAVTIDQEGGAVARIGAPATVFPGSMALGATFDPTLAYAQGSVLGAELSAMGINVDFAPVVDVNTNPANPVIGVRSLGEDPTAVAALGVSQIMGLQDNNVGASAKHFPGHGDTVTDSHYGLPTVTYDRETLDQHLVPFEAAIEADVDMIMTAHVIVEAIDPTMPGTLSHKVLTELLRDEMGFDGLVTTDALDMAALKQLPGMPLDDGDVAVLAVQAGSDILLMSPDVPATVEAISEAVDNGDITRERLEESVIRILQWKLDRGVWELDPAVDVSAVDGIVGNAEHGAVADEIGARAVTLLRNEDDVLPLDADEDSVLMVGAGSGWPERMGPMLVERGFDVTADYENGASPSAAYRDRAVATAQSEDIDAVIFTSNNATANAAQQQMVAALAETGKPVVVVSTRNPYDISVFPGADAVLNLYSWQVPSFRGAVAAVAGDVNPSGRLPVNIPTADGTEVLHPIGYGLSYGTAVTPAVPTFTDQPGTADDTFTIPVTEGVEYVVGEEDDAEVLEAGTYPGEGTVAIAAVPLEGYYLAWDAEALWAHTFDAAGEEPTTPGEEPTSQEPTTDAPPTTEAPTTDAPTTEQPSQPGTGGDLPSTGAEATGLVAGALLLLVLGAGAVHAVRRRQTV
ncbi:glycoside hydrolase family 3 protein [Georgenia wangjunii]|uniref:glycoside hydrolase family 3 protein n=1 Tax=Georgenia wangjunii TaxID=3117730 RepID=UPI002F260234